MLNRRHIRVKVLQTIYAMHQSGSDDLQKTEKFLIASMENLQDLYLLMISTLIEIREKEQTFLDISRKKHLATAEEKDPNTKFVDNIVLKFLTENKSIANAVEKRKINDWKQNDDYILLLLESTKNSVVYKTYMSNRINTFEEDRRFVMDLFSEVIAPNDKLYEFLEDHRLTWVDDIPLVNTIILKQLKAIDHTKESSFSVPALFRDEEDEEFAIQLFRKTALREYELAKEFIDRTPNWDPDRISEVDTIMLKMAICEFLHFPSIPIKVTINEYLEVAKEYATPKSSLFINGILDNLVKDFQRTNKLTKSGRGLL
ncbi:transcription antitermination protein NusB [Flavobacterium orientale]|nr:transcription antitermination protein NusB [Flavobacterium orientale]